MESSLSSMLAGPSVERPEVLRSVSSSSSLASVVSLTRRSRTRSRSRTVGGGGASGIRDRRGKSTVPDVPYLDKALVDEPLQITPSNSMAAEQSRSPAFPFVRALGEEPWADQSIGLDKASGSSNRTKAGKQAFSLPPINTNRPPPSAFNRVPLSHIDPSGVNVRDSVLTQDSEFTQQTITSSSVYPPSTSSASTELPPSPVSMNETQHEEVPIMDDYQTFDEDDVSYRLRLLVKNNYFLPPAHSKPVPSDFVTPSDLPKKSATPTFLDIFRIGKSKSKPTTPIGGNQTFDLITPALRTTSDSTTVSGFPPFMRPQASSQAHKSPAPAGLAERSGRVVVVREKMDDLVSAAKQAEQDMKARGVRRDQGSQRDLQDITDEMIDPTDAVDLPPPSSNYPFAVQASAIRGLGVQDSVGAALLADHLPPPLSPGVSSLDPDDSWRKALLKAAVGHSFDNLAAAAEGIMSSSSLKLGSFSSPLTSPAPSKVLGQRIISPPIIENSDGSISKSLNSSNQGQPRHTYRRGRGFSSPESRPSSHVPARVETPSTPLTPLLPPPRRQIINPLYSLSQTDLTAFDNETNLPSASLSTSNAAIRKNMSSPVMSDAYELGGRQTMTMTPPPLPDLSRASREYMRSSSRIDQETATANNDGTTASMYSADEGEDAENLSRASTSMTTHSDSQSFIDGSQPSPSPTASAFQDALGPPSGLDSSSAPQSDRPSIEYAPRTAFSPPPRVSSSLAHVPLFPPPRTTSHYRGDLQERRPLPFIRSRSEHGHSSPSAASSLDHRPPTAPSGPIGFEISAPEPVTPPFPTHRRGSVTPLSLHIPTTAINVMIHSAPPPSSPTSFFDTIQTQPSALDYIDASSSDESSDDDSPTEDPISAPQSPNQTNTSSLSGSTRAPFMRLGNHSTPHISRSRQELRPALPTDSRQPIGHIPQSATFFTQRNERGPPISSFDFYQYTRTMPHTSTRSSIDGVRRPATTETATSQTRQRDQESLRRLDGMLIQHMEAEKDTIRRIASNIQSDAHS